ncbi:MAG: hypothetical protein OXC69_05825 [Candidatus Tectomicrobia bacterium]|nr:hypothetical protein [Candidatus Tectomicrobia bacterium]
MCDPTVGDHDSLVSLDRAGIHFHDIDANGGRLAIDQVCVKRRG